MTGMSIIFAIFTAFATIILTSSCGDVTTIMPSSGRDWNTVSGTSPVPGGISTNIQSTSPHTTSLQNCFTVPASIGPRQMTGLVSSSMRRLRDITFMPVRVTTGRMCCPSIDSALSRFTPKERGIEGPVMSASSTATFLPLRAAPTASRAVTRDFPTPPFPLTTPITRFTLLSSFCLTRKLSLPHLDEQLSQS